MNNNKTLINLFVPQIAGNFLTWWASPGLFNMKLIFEVLINISSHCTNNCNNTCIVYMFHHSQDLQMIATVYILSLAASVPFRSRLFSKGPPNYCSNKLYPHSFIMLCVILVYTVYSHRSHSLRTHFGKGYGLAIRHSTWRYFSFKIKTEIKILPDYTSPLTYATELATQHVITTFTPDPAMRKGPNVNYNKWPFYQYLKKKKSKFSQIFSKHVSAHVSA